jgi:hypothetical protein
MKTQFESDWNFEELLQTLKKGSSQKFEDFVIVRKKNGRIEVRGYLTYNSKDEIPKDEIKNDLQKVKDRIIELLNKSHIFKEFVLEYGLDYTLDLDYGGGSILICEEKEGIYKEYI